MLNEAELSTFKQRLEEDLAVLEGAADYRRTSTQTAELDQTRAGRLSRMDAFQGQAMARATEARAGQEVLRLCSWVCAHRYQSAASRSGIGPATIAVYRLLG